MKSYSWTQAVCDECWGKLEPDRAPFRLKLREEEKCAYCGGLTWSGIYYRDDPANVSYPREKE